jgi:hypothetical protein
MKFETDLSKEQISSILYANTKPYNFSNSSTGNMFISKQQNDKIYLLKTGKTGKGRGQLPLVLNVIENDNKVTLQGGFRFTRADIVILTIFLSIAWFSFGNVFFNSDFDLSDQFVVFFLVSIWTSFVIALFLFSNKMLFSNQQKEVLDFIKIHLCAKEINS